MTNGINHTKNPVVQVAVAVLFYTCPKTGNKQYLVARRDDGKHQGGRLEFVGGKIEQGEPAATALVREIDEELGLDIGDNLTIKMGRIHHDYGDKSVCLHIFAVSLNDEQFGQFAHQATGAEGQALYWLNHDELLARRDEFPFANQRIFEWLQLPEILIISHDIAEFGSLVAWVDFYVSKLPKQAIFVLRVAKDYQNQAVNMLITHRDDIRWVVPMDFECDGLAMIVKRVTQSQLMNDDATNELQDVPLIISCHDVVSITKANALARTHKVMAILLSPVKATKTHPNAVILGLENFANLAKFSDVPVLALGGLGRTDLQELQAYGAWGVAGIRGMID